MHCSIPSSTDFLSLTEDINHAVTVSPPLLRLLGVEDIVDNLSHVIILLMLLGCFFDGLNVCDNKIFHRSIARVPSELLSVDFSPHCGVQHLLCNDFGDIPSRLHLLQHNRQCEHLVGHLKE